MQISIFQVNRAGLGKDTILAYQQTPKVQHMIADLEKHFILPPIKVYQLRNGKYTLADGINRLCAHLYLGILSFEAEVK